MDSGKQRTPGGISRRKFLSVAAGAAGVAALAGCAPAAAPAPAGSGPAGQPAGSTPPAAGQASQDKAWADLVSAAKAEGSLQILTLAGTTYRNGVAAFQAAFPEIKVEHEGVASMGPFSQKLIQERAA